MHQEKKLQAYAYQGGQQLKYELHGQIHFSLFRVTCFANPSKKMMIDIRWYFSYQIQSTVSTLKTERMHFKKNH